MRCRAKPCSMGVKGESEVSALVWVSRGAGTPYLVMGCRGAGTIPLLRVHGRNALIEGRGADEIAASSGAGGEAPRSEVQRAKRLWLGVEGQRSAPARCGVSRRFCVTKTHLAIR
jgi:hypothetical protein